MIHDKSLLEYMVPLGLCKDDVRAGTGGTKALSSFISGVHELLGPLAGGGARGATRSSQSI